MKLVKLLGFFGVVFASAGAAMAAGETNMVMAVESLTASVTSNITTLLPYLVGVVLVAFGIWLIPKGIHWVKGMVK